MTVQDDRGSRKKAWKAFQANYDDVFSLSDRLCSYCLTDQMVQAMLTMTEYLKWPTRWISTDADIDSDRIEAFASQMEWRLMNGCCDDNLPIQWQYTADGVLQMSTNGGSDWVDAPLYDPRVYSVTFPPLAGADGNDKKCIAATGAAALIKQQVGDQLTDGMSSYTLGQLITDWVKTMIQSSNPFEALLTVITNQIFALVISVLRPALTDDVYDQLKCILYCNMAADASFSTAAWQTVRSQILSQISGIAGIFFEHLVFLLGEKGITNLARAGGASSGTCDECCPVCGNDWEAGQWQDGVLVPYNIITERGDGYIVMSSYNADPTKLCVISSPASDSCCTILTTLLTGTTVNFYVIPCGTDHNYTNLVAGASGWCQENVNTLRVQSSVPFSVRFDFVDECP